MFLPPSPALLLSFFPILKFRIQQWLCPRCMKLKRSGKGKLPADKLRKMKKGSMAAGKPSGTASGKSKPPAPSPDASSPKKRKLPEEASGENKKRRRGVWTQEQEALLTLAVDKIGVGKWKQIVEQYNFDGKESHMLKDKWRRMEAKRLALEDRD